MLKSTTPIRAVVIGATGLVGTLLIELLLSSPQCEQIIALSRRPVDKQHPKLINILIPFINFNEEIRTALETYSPNVWFCAIGTTISKAKNRRAFAQIDLEIPMVAAQYCRQHHIDRFAVVSAMGADPHSLFSYNRVKGHMEKQLTALNLSHLMIFRPSLIIGQRKERRFWESLAQKYMRILDPFLVGSLKPYRSIQAKTIAEGMLAACQKSFVQPAMGTTIYDSEQIKELSQQLQR